MRRLLAAAFTAAVLVGAAACSDDGNGGGDGSAAPDQSDDNTVAVCTAARTVQTEQQQQLSADLAALQQEDLDEEEFAREAVAINQEALTRWSDGLAEQADAAEDPELAQALTDLSDGLAALVPQLTYEGLQTGEIPGVEDLDAIGQTLTEICEPALPDTPQPDSSPSQ